VRLGLMKLTRQPIHVGDEAIVDEQFLEHGCSRLILEYL
jgi:hypothetical protein